MVTASVAGTRSTEPLDDSGREQVARAHELAAQPHIHWAAAGGHGYLLVDVDHDRLRGEWWSVDDAHTPEGEHCATAYEVERGLARLLPAVATRAERA